MSLLKLFDDFPYTIPKLEKKVLTLRTLKPEWAHFTYVRKTYWLSDMTIDMIIKDEDKDRVTVLKKKLSISEAHAYIDGLIDMARGI